MSQKTKYDATNDRARLYEIPHAAFALRNGWQLVQ